MDFWGTPFPSDVRKVGEFFRQILGPIAGTRGGARLGMRRSQVSYRNHAKLIPGYPSIRSLVMFGLPRSLVNHVKKVLIEAVQSASRKVTEQIALLPLFLKEAKLRSV